MIQDYFKIALRSLKQRKTRSILTLLGIFLAILTIFVLLSLSLGLNDFVNEQFELLGTDKFFVQPKGQAGPPGASGNAVELTMDDVEVVEDVRGVEMVTYFTIGNGKLEFNDRSRYYLVMGMPVTDEHLDLIFETSDLEIEDGRFMKEGESGKSVVSYNYKYKNLFKKPLRTGDTLVVNGVDFEVVGVVSQVGNPADDQQVYLSDEDFKDLFDSGERVDFIYAQIKLGEEIGRAHV